MRVLFPLCLILLGICLINYGVDFAFFLKNRYCRYHIGRWDNESWKKAVEKCAVRWLKKTPTVKITDNSRYMLLDFLSGKYRSQTIQSWQKAALILGLLESGKTESQNSARKAAANLLEPDGAWRIKPTRVDCGMLSYALLRTEEEPNTIKAAMLESIAVIEQSTNREGLISYTGQTNNPEMYVDTLGLTCPFLVRFGQQFNQPQYAEMAFRQIKNYHDNGLLHSSALPNHAYSEKYNLPLGVYGWGRGIGWYVISLLDCYEEIREEEHRSVLRQWIREAADSYKQFQRTDGGFGAIVQSTYSYDSSATAVLAWFYARCSKIFVSDEYREIADKCLDKLRSVTRITGAIDWCQGDTKGIGVFSQTYDIMPFAQGMTLRAIYELEEAKN